MKTFLSLGFILVLLTGMALVMVPAEQVDAGPKVFCDDLPRDFVDPNDTVLHYVCFWKNTIGKTCPIYVDAKTGEHFVDGGPAGCDIP